MAEPGSKKQRSLSMLNSKLPNYFFGAGFPVDSKLVETIQFSNKIVDFSWYWNISRTYNNIVYLLLKKDDMAIYEVYIKNPIWKSSDEFECFQIPEYVLIYFQN